MLDRIDMIRNIPAGVRFLSVEPMIGDLGEVDLTGIDWVICVVSTLTPVPSGWSGSARLGPMLGAGHPVLLQAVGHGAFQSARSALPGGYEPRPIHRVG